MLESPYNRPSTAQRGSGNLALLILDHGASTGCVVSTTSRPLYPEKNPVFIVQESVYSRDGLEGIE
jgi:hypothetical protein